MDVKYITVKANKLATIPIVDGQIIAISDKNAWFYDMENIRRPVSGQQLVTKLPTNIDDIYANTLYIVPEGVEEGIHVWTGAEFINVANTNTDENVKTLVNEVGKSYVVGSPEDKDSTGALQKTTKVYVDNVTGKLHAEGFSGGAAEKALSADKATEADIATSDNKKQNIAQTYIKSIKAEGTKVTATYGDDTTKSFNTQDTNTHSRTNVVFTSSDTSQENLVAKNGEVCMNISDDNVLRSSHKITGSGSVEVTSDTAGNLDIKGTDTWQPNTHDQAGYVAPGEPDSIWATDEEGTPSWQKMTSDYEHPNSGVIAGTYTKVKVDLQGHVTEGSNPETLAGYGIKDAAAYIVLPDNADLDAQWTPGFYVGVSGNSIKNKPDNVNSFGMIVTKNSNGGYGTQRLFSSGETISGVSTSTDEYTRHSRNNVLTEWSVNKLTDTVYEHPTGSGTMHIPVGGDSGQVLIWKEDGVAEWGNPSAMLVEVMQGSTTTADGKSGVVPAPLAGPAEAYLRNDGSWAIPPNTTYREMVGATEESDGQSGLVPQPTKADVNKFLGSDAQWHTIDTSEYRAVWEEFRP